MFQIKKKKWKYEFSHQKWILMNESPNNNNFVTCRTAASKLTRGQKCFALIQILYFKSKRIQICYFDRHDYTEKKAQKITIEKKKLVEKIKWKLGLEGGNKKKNVEFWFFFLFGTANFFSFLFICWCCYYYYYWHWFQIPWYLLFCKTKYKAHCLRSVLKPWILSWIW